MRRFHCLVAREKTAVDPVQAVFHAIRATGPPGRRTQRPSSRSPSFRRCHALRGPQVAPRFPDIFRPRSLRSSPGAAIDCWARMHTMPGNAHKHNINRARRRGHIMTLPLWQNSRAPSGLSSREFSRNPNPFGADVRVAFGACEFDSVRHVLLRHGRPVPLSPRAFRLLEVLLDRRPEVMSKADLLEHLWPGTFVSDASLHNLVTEVRARQSVTLRRRRDSSGRFRDAGMASTVMSTTTQPSHGSRPTALAKALDSSRSTTNGASLTVHI